MLTLIKFVTTSLGSSLLSVVPLDGGPGHKSDGSKYEFLVVLLNAGSSVLAPGLSPGVLDDPIAVTVLNSLPTDDLDRLVLSELGNVVNDLIDALLVGEEVGIHEEEGDHWTVVHDLTLYVLEVLEEAVVLDAKGIVTLFRALNVPFVGVVREAASLIEALVGASGEVVGGRQVASFAFLALHLWVAGGVALRVELVALVGVGVHAPTVGEGSGSGDDVSRAAVALWGKDE